MKVEKKIIISGGNGHLAKKIIRYNKSFDILAPDKSALNILDKDNLSLYFKKNKPDIFIHAAAYTRPMQKHAMFPEKSIETNILGTSNVVIECIKHNIKLIYISTDYVYPGVKGDYNEDDALSPFEGNKDGINKYGWSKLGGECAVKIYDNSLIVRLCMSSKPFPHDKAPSDVIKSYLYADDAAKIILRLLDYNGVINVGGKSQSIYEFAVIENPNIKKIRKKSIKDVLIAPNTSMNISKLNEILKN